MWLVAAVAEAYVIALVLRAIFSWLPARWRANEFYGFLHAVTEPLLQPLRRLVPPVGGVDFSPLIAIVLIQLLLRILL